MNLVVIPAYGRDYKTEIEALTDWLNGKDFEVAGPSRFRGKYCSIRDAKDNTSFPNEDVNFPSIASVEIRFNKLRGMTIWQA